MPVNTNPGIPGGPQLFMEQAGTHQQLTVPEPTEKLRTSAFLKLENIFIMNAFPGEPKNYFFDGKRLDLNLKKKYS